MVDIFYLLIVAAVMSFITALILYRFIGPPSTDSPYSHGQEIFTETFVSRQEFHDSKPVIRTSSAFGTLVCGVVILAASLFFIGSSRD
jgi:hypothetical protein